MEENAHKTVSAVPEPVTTTTNMKSNNVDTTATVAEVTTVTAAQGGSAGLAFKKRGRPRKYGSDGKLNIHYPRKYGPKSPLGLPSPTLTASTNCQLPFPSFGEVFPNTLCEDFMPLVVTVDIGEDVCVKIMSFAQKGPGGICILAANGCVSNVAIRQLGSSGGTLTYEGRFEILSLSGSFTLAENSDKRIRSGGLSVSLAAPDGQVIGGAVAGVLTAASPIQVVMGSFTPNSHKTHKKKGEHALASPISPDPDTMAETKPILPANPNNFDGKNFRISASQLPEQSQREPTSVTTNGDKQNLDATPNVATWNGSEQFSDQRISPQIKIEEAGMVIE